MRSLHLSTTVPVCFAFLGALAACGGNPPPVDGGIDAPGDAHVPTDATSDTAQPDAGPPDPVGVAGRMTRMELMRVVAERDAIPIGERTAAVYVDLDIAIGRLDAIIGEKGLLFTSGIIGEKGLMMALALNDRAVPAIVIVRELHTILKQLNRIAVQLARLDRPSLRSAVDRTISSATALHSQLTARFGELAVDSTIMPVVDDTFVSTRVIEVPTQGLSVHAIVEAGTGLSPAVAYDCGPSDMTATVYDDETGAMLAGPFGGSGRQGTSFSAAIDDPIALRIEIVDSARDRNWDHCSLTITGRRRYRGPQIDLAPVSARLERESRNWSSHMLTLEGVVTTVSTAPADVQDHVALVVDIAGQLTAANSAWRGPPASIGPDDLHILRLTLDLLLPAAIAVRDHPHYAATEYTEARLALDDLIMVSNNARTILGI